MMTKGVEGIINKDIDREVETIEMMIDIIIDMITDLIFKCVDLELQPCLALCLCI